MKKQKKKTGNLRSIVGTGAVGNIKMVKTRLVSVFTSRFSPDLNTELYLCILKKKTEVTCQRIDTVNSRYASFKVSAECKNVGEMHNLELWPEGAFVPCYYEPCKA